MLRFEMARFAVAYGGSTSSGEVIEPQEAELSTRMPRQIETPWTALPWPRRRA